MTIMKRDLSLQTSLLIDKATSQMLLEPNWEAVMTICDSIRQGDTQAKHVIAPLKKKISQDNPHVTIFALGVLESMMKNCGSLVHDEVATKEFMEYMKDLAKNRADPVKGKVLEMIQVWSHAFRNTPSYKIVQDTYNVMRVEGYQFPTLKEADALFQSEKAPDWKEGDCCHRCRVSFGMVQRKHHCRNCGQIFCAKCSSKSSIIPKYGIEKEVRVCISCYDSLNKTSSSSGSSTSKEESELPAEYLASPLAKQSQAPPSRTEQELQEKEELELAIALSKSEAEQSNRKSRSSGGSSSKSSSSSSNHHNTPNSSDQQTYSSAVVTAPVLDTSDMDPELAHYLNRNYWQQKQQDAANAASPAVTNNSSAADSVATTQPSAPLATNSAAKVSLGGAKIQERFQNGGTGQQEEEEFQAALNGSIDIFINRMMSDHQRGRSIYSDSSVQTLFQTISQMHPQLINTTKHLEDERTYYEGLQDKLAQLKDAREALDALREEHREKMRREAEEAERQRQIQMHQKLEIMRQQKQQYLEYQRQLALQRMQEQERMLAERLQQQKQYQYHIAMYGQQYPGAAPPPGGVGVGMAPPVGGGMLPPGAMPPSGAPGTMAPPGQQQIDSSPLHQPYPGAQPHQQPPYQQMPPGQPLQQYQPPPASAGTMPPQPPVQPGMGAGGPADPSQSQYASPPPAGSQPYVVQQLPPTQYGGPPGGYNPALPPPMQQMPPIAGSQPQQQGVPGAAGYGPPQPNTGGLPATTAATGYSAAPPPQQQQQPQQPATDPYNMQSLSGAMPPQGAQSGMPPQQQPPAPSGMYAAPPGAPMGAALPPQQQQQPDEQLISFE